MAILKYKDANGDWISLLGGTSSGDTSENTWRNIKVEDVLLIDTSTSSGALNFKATGAASVSGSGNDITIGAVDTTYTFENGTNCFYVTPSVGSKQTVDVTPSITNNITGSGTNGCIAIFNGKNTITDGPTFGTDTTTYLRNDGMWATLPNNNDNYYHTPLYLEGLSIATGTGVNALYVPNATSSQSGVVTTAAQTFAGAKTFNTSVKTPYVYNNADGTGSVGTGTTNRFNYGYFNYLYGKNIYINPITYSGTIYLTGFSDIPSASSIANARLYASPYAMIKNSDASAAIYAPGGFYESSDERLKTILNPVNVDLDELSKLRKIYYTWKNNSKSGIQLGIIAQDVQKLYPELIDTDKETGFLSLAYDKLSVIALAAVDTLYKEHIRLKERVDKLEKYLHSKGIS